MKLIGKLIAVILFLTLISRSAVAADEGKLEKFEEQIEEPTHPGSHHADDREQTDDAEDECAEQDFLGERHIGRFNAGKE